MLYSWKNESGAAEDGPAVHHRAFTQDQYESAENYGKESAQETKDAEGLLQFYNAYKRASGLSGNCESQPNVRADTWTVCCPRLRFRCRGRGSALLPRRSAMAYRFIPPNN